MGKWSKWIQNQTYVSDIRLFMFGQRFKSVIFNEGGGLIYMKCEVLIANAPVDVGTKSGLQMC